MQLNIVACKTKLWHFNIIYHNLLRKLVQVSILIIFFTGLSNIPAWSWSNSPKVNTPIATGPEEQESPQLASDEKGGAIIVWHSDLFSGNIDIYAQRRDREGRLLWDIPIATSVKRQEDPQIIADGSGGAIIVWEEYYSSTDIDIWVQMVDSQGTAVWTGGGIRVCAATGNQEKVQLVSDGAGGAIIAWQDYRSGSNWDIYVSRIKSDGTLSWNTNGVGISISTGDQISPQITTDGSSGAVIAWGSDEKGNSDIFAQRINGGGTPQWTVNGVAMSSFSNDELNPQIISDGSSGAIITWHLEFAADDNDVYAKRVNSDGSTNWGGDTGMSISARINDQQNPQLISDGAGGAVFTWEDNRTGLDNFDIYAQRVNGSGVMQWTSGDVAVSVASGDQKNPQITSSESSGVIITWEDQRDIPNSRKDIYAQQMNFAGYILWAADGVAISTNSSYQFFPQLVPDDSGGAIITWEDLRPGSISDVYAQRISSDGRLRDPYHKFFIIRTTGNKAVVISP